MANAVKARARRHNAGGIEEDDCMSGKAPTLDLEPGECIALSIALARLCVAKVSPDPLANR
jgi:hypothetical protein